MPSQQSQQRRGKTLRQDLLPDSSSDGTDLLAQSPQWVSGADIVFKTPSSFSPMKTRRRTTMLHEEITATRQDFALQKRNKLQVNDSEFKVPSLMFSSPPGVKTRNRRASVYAASSRQVKQTTTTVKVSTKVKKAVKAKETSTVVKRAGRPASTLKTGASKLTSEKVLLSSALTSEEDADTIVSKSSSQTLKKAGAGKKEKMGTKATPKAGKRKSTGTEKDLSLNVSSSSPNVDSDVAMSAKKSRRFTKRKSILNESRKIDETVHEESFTQIKARASSPVIKQTPKKQIITKTADKSRSTRSVRRSMVQSAKMALVDVSSNNDTPLKLKNGLGLTPVTFSTPKSVLKERLIQARSVQKNDSKAKLEEKSTSTSHVKVLNTSSVEQIKEINYEDIENESNIIDLPPVSSDDTLNSTSELNLTVSRSSTSNWCTIL